MLSEKTHNQVRRISSDLIFPGNVLQRKCACGIHTMGGGQCAECQKKKMGVGGQPLQTKLAISEPGDAYEQEADRVAEQVMRMSPGDVRRRQSGHQAQSLVQRRATGGTTGLAEVPPSVHEVLNSPGRPLEPALQQDMEQRFGYDFSRVRVHSGATAAQSTQDVNAHAYTVGHNIVFDADQFATGSHDGRRLVAHELTHVVQQSGRPGTVSALPGQSLHRKVKVDKPKDFIANPTGKGLVQTNAQTVEGYLQTLCSGGSVAVDGSTGDVKVDPSFCTQPGFQIGHEVLPAGPVPASVSKEPTGCGCLCDMVGSADDYTIVVDDNDWPHTLGRVVTAPSPNSSKLWGAATISGKAMAIDPWLVLGHEFCGHAWLAEKGLPDNNATRGEGGHQETVERENALRKEHGIEARGSFKDPYCGESFWRDKAGPGPVQWSSFLKVCEAWRKKTYGGKYKISDKIP